MNIQQKLSQPKYNACYFAQGTELNQEWFCSHEFHFLFKIFLHSLLSVNSVIALLLYSPSQDSPSGGYCYRSSPLQGLHVRGKTMKTFTVNFTVCNRFPRGSLQIFRRRQPCEPLPFRDTTKTPRHSDESWNHERSWSCPFEKRSGDVARFLYGSHASQFAMKTGDEKWVGGWQNVDMLYNLKGSEGWRTSRNDDGSDETVANEKAADKTLPGVTSHAWSGQSGHRSGD